MKTKIKYPISINGRVVDNIEFSVTAKEIENEVYEFIKKHYIIKKVIVVQDKMVNIVM